MDDKWTFTRSYVEQEGHRAGFRQVTVTPLNPSHSNQTPFTQQTDKLLRLSPQRDLQALPQWARDTLAQADAQFSHGIIGEVIIEGIIVLHK